MPTAPLRRAHRPLATVFLLAILGLLALPSRSAAQTKRIYIADDNHTDYFWSGDDAQYRAVFTSTLDYYVTQAENTATNPPDARSRFNCDGSLWLWEYERNRSATQLQRLMGHVRSGDITVPLNTLVLLYGAMPAEAVLRNMYYAGRIERRENLRFPLVVPQENQTLPGGVASLWAGSGALYAWKGVCGCVTKTPWGNRPREIYQFQGPDGARVCMKWNTMRNGNASVGGYAEARNPSGVVDYLDTDAAFLASWPWPVSAAFGYGWDDLQTTTNAFVSASLAKANVGRRVIVSNEIDFFQDFLANYGGQIPTFSGSFGNEWDLYTASMGEVTADFKRHVERLRSAEALATVASVFDPSFMSGREAARDKAFLACGLFYEHDWTADGVVARSRRAQFQHDMLRDLGSYVDTLYAQGLAAVAGRVAQPGTSERHMVFNPLAWTRTDFADLPIAQTPPVHAIDVATGAEVPSQVVGSGPATMLRILASNVPSVGYRVYEVRAGAGQAFPPSATVTGSSADNGTYAVSLSGRGQITSLIDHKDANRQLVAAGGALHDAGSGNGSVQTENAGPVSTTLRVVAGGTPAHETRVTLYAGIDRVDIEGLVTQNFGNTVTYASSFDLPGSTMRHEEVGMIARVARAAQGGDYADQNTRTDYLSFNHFVDISQSGRGVTVSNWDSPFFQAGNSTVSVLDGSTPSIRAVVGMQVDGTALGIPNQDGMTRFLDRFALRTHGAYDPASAMRMALEHQNPLIAARVGGSAGSPLPATSWSLVSLPSPDLLLWALKPAEEGIAAGIVARVWNLAEGTRTLQLSLPALGITRAQNATHIETDLGPATLLSGAVQDNLARQQMKTYRLFPGAPPADVTPPASILDLESR